MPGRQKRPALPPEGIPVQEKINEWRATKRNGAPMPEELWNSAVCLARRHGLYPIAKGLPVDYGALKMRLAGAETGESEEVPGAPGFVEIDPAPLLGASEFVGAVVELSRPDGAQMVIRLGQRETLDVTSLSAAFCGSGS